MLSEIEQKALLTNVLSEMKQPHWDAITVEEDLNILWECCLFKAQKIQEAHSSLSLEQAKFNAACELFNESTDCPAIAEFFAEKREFVLLKCLFPQIFDLHVQNCLNKLADMCRFGGDDYLYFPLLETFCALFNAMPSDEQKRVQSLFDPLLASSNLSFSLFIKLLPFASEAAQSELIAVKIEKWKHDFSYGLKCGDLGLVHDALFFLAHRRFMMAIQSQLLVKEISIYAEALQSINSIPSIHTSLEEIVRINYQMRMENLETGIIPEETLDFYKSIVLEEEMGLALRKLCLLEEYLQGGKDSNFLLEIQLILALEKKDLEGVQQLLTLGNLAPWDNLGNEDTLIGIATQKAVLDQSESEREFYIQFHHLVSKKILKDDWRQVISSLTLVAFRGNGVFIGRSKSLFLGQWEFPEALYKALLKIYLPKNEHDQWKKYCIHSTTQDLGELMQDAYQGGAETYGLWFHLMQKAIVEKVRKGAEGEAVFWELGQDRRLVSLFLMNIQVPRGQAVTLAARIQQEGIDKIWPGSPLNFGILDSAWNTSHTTLLNEIRSHYLKKTTAFIQSFNQHYALELKDLENSKSHYIKVCSYPYQGREVLVYFFENEFRYAIVFPIVIEGEIRSGIHILWNWPPATSFIYPGHLKKITPNVPFFNPIWVHPSGEDKQKMYEQIAILFTLLTRSELTQVEFECHLGRFIYLFSQCLCYKRGSASIGLVLLSALLHLRGLEVLDVPPRPFFLDCEAMCSTEEEFITGFTVWRLTGCFPLKII